MPNTRTTCREILAAKKAEVATSCEASRALDTDVEIPAPAGLSYLPFQRAGIAYAISRPNVLIADEMGLGKTIQAIGVINADPTIRKILVVCPASLKLNWKREIEKWSTRPLTVGIADTKTLPATDVVIVNYDVTHKHAGDLRATQWDLLICDEVHFCKNTKARRTEQIAGAWNRKAGSWKVEPL